MHFYLLNLAVLEREDPHFAKAEMAMVETEDRQIYNQPPCLRTRSRQGSLTLKCLRIWLKSSISNLNLLHTFYISWSSAWKTQTRRSLPFIWSRVLTGPVPSFSTVCSIFLSQCIFCITKPFSLGRWLYWWLRWLLSFLILTSLVSRTWILGNNYHPHFPFLISFFPFISILRTLSKFVLDLLFSFLLWFYIFQYGFSFCHCILIFLQSWLILPIFLFTSFYFLLK